MSSEKRLEFLLLKLLSAPSRRYPIDLFHLDERVHTESSAF